MGTPLDPFRAWRRIVESARPRRPPRGLHRRPEPSPEARALVAAVLAREHVYRPIAAADWPRAELVARSAAFLHLAEALVRAHTGPERSGSTGFAQPIAERVLEKPTAAGVAPEGDAVDWSAVEGQARVLADHLASAAAIAEREYRDNPLPDPDREVRDAAREVGRISPSWPREAFWRLGPSGALAYVLREMADAVRDNPELLIGRVSRARSDRLPLWRRFGRRGGAADAGGRVRGALARELDLYLPSDAPGRLTTIAELLTAAGLPTTPATVRRLITRH